MVAIKLPTKRIFLLAVLLALLLPVLIPAGGTVYALADNTPTGSGSSSAESGCGKYPYGPSTCWGAGWFYHNFEQKGALSLRGGLSYAVAGTITKESCRGAAGVFYYGFLEGSTARGFSHIGAPPAEAWRRSEKLGGGTRYNSAFSWEAMTGYYAQAWKLDTDGQLAAYGPNAFSNPASTLSNFCFSLEEEEEEQEAPKPEPVSCEAGSLPGLAVNENYGNSAAESAVVNLTKKEPWDLHTSHSAKKFTLAKPGDSIQFKHAYCYGSSAVKTNESYGGARNHIETTSYFQIEARSTNGGTKEYRFGGAGTNQPTKLQNNVFDSVIQIKVSGGDIVSSSPAGVTNHLDDVVKYGFTTLSPAKDAGNRYDCAFHKPFVTAGYKFVEPGYQTNGFTALDGTCKSFNEVGSKNDAGTTITQKLSWTQTRAFIHNWHEDNGVECTCNPDQTGKLITNGINDSWPGQSVYGEQDPAKTECREETCSMYDPSGCVGTDASGNSYTYGCDVPHTGYGWDGPSLKFEEGPRDEPSAPDQSEEVHALIPYNYDTAVASSVNTNIAYAGEYVDTSFFWGIFGRGNPDVFEMPYATISRPTRVLAVEFVVSPNDYGSPDQVKDGFQPSESGGDNGVISYFGGTKGLTITSHNTIYDSGMVEYNEKGDPNGASYNYTGGTRRKLPDAEPGTKYCVAIGIWPSDSHNRPDEALGEGVNDLGQVNNGQRGNYSGNKWRISGASCRTINKKPNFQVWGANLFTRGSINTSISEKNPGDTSLGQWGGFSHVFGSWEDYGVIAGGSIRNFASAGGYGYENNRQILPTGGAQAGKWNFCNDLSKLTFGNGTCNYNSTGGVSITPSDAILERLKSRYIPTTTEANLRPSIDPSNTVAYPFCSAVSGWELCKELVSGATYIKVRDGASISSILAPGFSGRTADGNSDNKTTIIIDATGRTLNIDANICYLDPTCRNNSSTWSNYLSSNSTSISDITVLPQVLIFAKNINISANVSQIDAWLIADAGTINTCKQFVKGSYGSITNITGGTSTLECNYTLNVNGPVFAKSLLLNRTAGANPGTGIPNGEIAWPDQQNLADDGSVTPAEIFNLRPDTYYWAYSQAQRYSQAIVTYSRELAPRY